MARPVRDRRILDSRVIPIQDVVPTGRLPLATLGLMAASVAAYLAGPAAAGLPGLSELWTLFAHAGWAQLVAGLLFLWLFGDNVEARLGRRLFLLTYALGAGASLLGLVQLQLPLQPGSVASGAITAILGAYLVLLPQSRILMLVPSPLVLAEVPAAFFIGLWWALLLLTYVALPAVARLDTGGLVLMWGFMLAFVTGAAIARVARRPVSW